MIAGYDYPRHYDTEHLLKDLPDDCPKCGGKMEQDEVCDDYASVKCTNCGHVESNEPYHDF